VVDAAMRVHTALGPGLLESAYECALAYEVRKRGFEVATQVGLPLLYDGVRLEVGYRLDMVVDNCVVVEIKAVDALADIHRAQLLSYLKLGGFKVGLLLNFNVVRMKEGIIRLVN
jgi:GxxExxY protein